MKNVYFVQPNSVLSKSVFLPYSSGAIAAYAFQYENIKKAYRLCDFIFIKKPIDDIISQMSEPDVAGFSCYMWNVEYNLEFAKKIKAKWPDCITVFGGPQIPDSTEYLEEYDFIDVLIHGEGEIPFYSILEKRISGKNFDNIANISFRNEKDFIKTKKEVAESLENFPSPYETGLFDSIVNDSQYASVNFDAVLETNRGCPYACAYCYWSRSGASFRQFPIKRVKNDIEWIAKHGISYCICADSNFGILERDQEIADYVIKMKQKYGFPDIFETVFAWRSLLLRNTRYHKTKRLVNLCTNKKEGVSPSLAFYKSPAIVNQS